MHRRLWTYNKYVAVGFQHSVDLLVSCKYTLHTTLKPLSINTKLTNTIIKKMYHYIIAQVQTPSDRTNNTTYMQIQQAQNP